MENLNSPPQQPPQQSGEGSSSAEAELEQLALEAEGGAPGATAAAAASTEADKPRPTINSQDFIARMLKPFEQLAPKLPYVGYGFQQMPWTAVDTAMLAAGWAEVLDHYGGVSKLGPWGTAVVCTAAVLGPRAAIQPPPKSDESKP